jgi:alkyl hydroperoxide reductase subunit F
VAGGKIPRHLDVPGEDQMLGRGITYCANCDAPLFKGKEVVVVGGGNSALDAAILLDKLASKITVVNIAKDFNTNADKVMQDKLAASDKVSIVHDTAVTEIIGDKFVTKVKTKNNSSGQENEFPCNGVFIEIGSLPSVDYLGGKVKLNPRNEIIIDEWNMTNVPGIFAAGDVTTVIDKQVIVAAGEGAKAALSVFTYLARQK